MKNSLWVLCVFLFCGNAFALPQDWPCFGIEVEPSEIINNSEDYFEYIYKGEEKGYSLSVNLSGYRDVPSSFANCGNSGCVGIITEMATNRTESLRFFCEKYNDDYTKVTCNIVFGEEVIFDNMKNGNYEVQYCSDNKKKIMRFNLSDCKKCHCTMYWYDENDKDKVYQNEMACKKEGNKAHCFTYYGYEVWQNFQNEDDDFKNCVDLGF